MIKLSMTAMNSDNCRQGIDYINPEASCTPRTGQISDRLTGTVSPRQIAPRRADTPNVKDTAQNTLPHSTLLVRQERLNEPPFPIVQSSRAIAPSGPGK